MAERSLDLRRRATRTVFASLPSSPQSPRWRGRSLWRPPRRSSIPGSEPAIPSRSSRSSMDHPWTASCRRAPGSSRCSSWPCRWRFGRCRLKSRCDRFVLQPTSIALWNIQRLDFEPLTESTWAMPLPIRPLPMTVTWLMPLEPDDIVRRITRLMRLDMLWAQIGISWR